MAQEDKLKKQIDKISLLLSKLTNKLLQQNNEQKDVLNVVSSSLESELNIDLFKVLEMNDKEEVEYLIRDKEFSIDHLREFGDLIFELAYRITDSDLKNKLNRKALIIYEYITANGKGIIFLDVQYKIKELKAAK
ncbi:MAG TPA: hypothetical protein VN721_13870 [Flavipsychrobacter sp.]|nr:hypothetical protein [Flavipsychrobacter sp.]